MFGRSSRPPAKACSRPSRFPPDFGMRSGMACPISEARFARTFARYRGTGAKELQARERLVEAVNPVMVRFHLKEPWPERPAYHTAR